MKPLRAVLALILDLLQAILYGWIVNGKEIIQRFIETIKAFCRYLKLSHDERNQLHDKCGRFDHPTLKQPDPCIYSQQYLMSLGLPVTWDNPDIALLLGGVPVPETNLQPATAYEIQATIWNNSYDAPVVGLRVEFSFLSFGAATTSSAIGVTYVDLGVKGGANCPAIAKMIWVTPPTAGHFCIQVQLLWADDKNPANNLGQNNVDVAEAHSPATFTFRLRNDTDTSNTYGFETDSYTIPGQPDCAATTVESPPPTYAERVRRARARHNKANYRVPPGWTVGIVPPQVALAPGGEVDIGVAIEPPPGFTGTQPFNINARYKDRYAGGVTLYVTKN